MELFALASFGLLMHKSKIILIKLAKLQLSHGMIDDAGRFLEESFKTNKINNNWRITKKQSWYWLKKIFSIFWPRCRSLEDKHLFFKNLFFDKKKLFPFIKRINQFSMCFKPKVIDLLILCLFHWQIFCSNNLTKQSPLLAKFHYLHLVAILLFYLFISMLNQRSKKTKPGYHQQ